MAIAVDWDLKHQTKQNKLIDVKLPGPRTYNASLKLSKT